jgi:hypothetical protein
MLKVKDHIENNRLKKLQKQWEIDKINDACESFEKLVNYRAS